MRALFRTVRLLPICCAALLLVPGCTTSHVGAASTSNYLRYPLTTAPTDLDPARVQDGTTIDLLQNIFEGLVAWNEKSQIVPNLAESWVVSNGGRTYTFHLRPGVKFQNGREVTAQDFKYSIDRACDPATRSQTAADYLNDIVGAMDCIEGKAKGVSGVKPLDKDTLQITIDAPKSYWIDKLTYPTAWAVCREAIEKEGGVVDERSAVGTGPFMIAKPSDYQRGYQVTLTAFPGYHGGKPALSGIVRPILQDASTRLNQFAAGDLDITPVSPADLDRIDSDPRLKPDLKSWDRAATWYVALNQDAPGSPFKSKAVRQAFNMAIDKEEVIRVAQKGIVPVANAICPPGMGDFVSTCKPLPYDVPRAQQLMASAGYPGGRGFPRLTLTYRNDLPDVVATAQVLANQLEKDLGISIQCQGMEWPVFLNERNKKTMALSFLRWGADYMDPQDFLSVLLHTDRVVNGVPDHPENGVGYSNPAFDRLCDEADVEQNHATRMKLYQQAEQIAIDDAPWVPLYYQRDLELVSPRVHGIRDCLLGHLPWTTTTLGR